MDYIIESFQDGKQVLGSDYSRIVRNAKTMKKVQNAMILLKDYHSKMINKKVLIYKISIL